MISSDTKKFMKYMKEGKWALKADAPELAKKAFREFNKMYKAFEDDVETTTQVVKTNYSIDDFKDRLDSPLGCKIITPPKLKKRATSKKKEINRG